MVDNNGYNAFHESVASAMENALRCLIRLVRPAELLNRIDINGHTPLLLAAKMNRVECGLLLLNDLRVDP
jgi:ankyrin repeat protein